jgi:DNA-directed RNA polymerase specialized sigma24 family protein
VSALSDPALSEAIKGYETALLPFAQRLVGRDGAELDDLVQEGRISIWGALAKGVPPSMDTAFNRMRMWCRHLKPQNPVDYLEIERADG